MEKKGSIKVSLSTVFLILAIIVIAIMGYFIYSLSEKNKSSEEEVTSLNLKVSNLESTVKNYEEKIDNISNTLNLANTAVNNSKINTSTNSSSATESSDSKYSEITNELENDDLLQVSDTINNNDGTYTLKGKIITADWANQRAEFPPYKETGEYKQITIPANTKYIYEIGDEDTIKNVISKKLYSNAGMGPCFNFTFENGKCISVNEVATGH